MLSGLSTDQTMCMLKGTMAPCRGWLAIYPGLSNDRPWDNYHLCIVVKCTACWPTMYVVSVLQGTLAWDISLWFGITTM